jgi:hypothetical protein
MALFVKLVSDLVYTFQLAFARSIIQWILTLIALAVMRVNPLGPSDKRVFLFLRGIAGSLHYTFMFRVFI